MSHTINTLDFGQGRPMIFQHGLAAKAQQIFGLLDGIGNRVISIDCPGHGKSILPDDVDVSFEYYTDVIIKQLNRLGIDQAIFGGLSMGSGIALQAALRYPDRVQALILHRPAWLEQGFPDNLMELKDATNYMRMENGKDEFAKTEAFVKLKTELPAAADSVMGIFSEEQQSCLPKVIEQMVADSPISSLNQLAKLSMPCLILANDDDPLHPYELAKVIHKRISGSVLRKITSRYLEPVKHRDEVRHHILEFIKTLE